MTDINKSHIFIMLRIYIKEAQIPDAWVQIQAGIPSTSDFLIGFVKISRSLWSWLDGSWGTA